MSNTNKKLLKKLGVEVEEKTKDALSDKQGRIIAGFEDIKNFIEEKGHLPSHSADKDIFERIYAMRLEQIRSQQDCIELLRDYDRQGLLDNSAVADPEALKKLDNEELLSELGVEADTPSDDDIAELRHVRSPAEIKAAEEIASRTTCEDFDQFKPIFDALSSEIELGQRQVRPFKDDARVEPGNIFILNGQRLYIAEKGEVFMQDYGQRDSRLRVIYDNKTESDILMRTLTRALNKDENGRRITDLEAGPLFASVSDADDVSTGTIYVCRSLSEDTYIKKNRTIVHKIGVTGTSIERRLANTENDPTFLMANVEVVATYELFNNINRTKLERTLHRFFADARLDIEIKDRFGKPITPKEWFVLQFDVIEQVIDLIKDGEIVKYRYDRETATIVKR